MTGSLLNPTKADFSPEGVLPHESAMHPRARIGTCTVASPRVRPTRLKRILSGWMAAASAYRQRQAALLASHRASGRKLDNERIYRGPIDDALERAARVRQRRRRKQSLN
ncbi:hypothetical protein [Bradyrhizobium roseum]|uniref:hypothetical protein n=1 Tax=Bradyrhizobium roseum TaxID=3056648 RepID=UPI0026123192|nr:hypothetical protein [Bradyrhizobium roseus]WKA30947.1 hypothetical protein QUH67_12535 [Bradyrhizobium roseus]